MNAACDQKAAASLRVFAPESANVLGLRGQQRRKLRAVLNNKTLPASLPASPNAPFNASTDGLIVRAGFSSGDRGRCLWRSAGQLKGLAGEGVVLSLSHGGGGAALRALTSGG